MPQNPAEAPKRGHATVKGQPPGRERRGRIREDVCDRLGDSMDAGDISVEVKSGEVTLSGNVRERWIKHQAEQIAEGIGGVKEIHNQIRVQHEGEQDKMSSTSMQSGGSRNKTGSESSTSANQYAQNSR
jgi:hypothetical protein